MISASADAYDAKLRQLIEDEVAQLVDNLGQGTSVSDYPTYRGEVGRIAGLRLALELCDTAASELNKR